MPWKLLAFIATMTIALVFVGFNLENSCDISIVFITFPQVPVVITILASFVLGLLAAFFLSLGQGRSRGKAKPSREGSSRQAPRAPGMGGVEGAIAGEPLTEPSAGGKKPRAPAKKTPRGERGEPGYPDGK